MALSFREGLTKSSVEPKQSLVTSLTSLLQTLNPSNPDGSIKKGKRSSSPRMALPLRKALTRHSAESKQSLVTSITSLLQTLNPQNASNPDSQPLKQFSADLDPILVIQVIKNQTNPYHALFFFNWATKPDPNPKCYSHTYHCYVAMTDVLLSHSLFSTAYSLLRKSQKVSDFMIGKFIKAFGDRGDIRGAIHWFQKAKSIENGRCLFSYNAILGVLVRANRVNMAKAFFDQIVTEGVVKPDVSTYTIMIKGFCKMGLVENAHKLFDEMVCEPNVITYNTIINGFCKKGDTANARRILNRIMESKDCLPDAVTYTTLIDGYCKKGEIHEALNCLDEMVKQGCQPNLLTYNALIEGLCLSGNVDEAKRMMTKMRLSGLKDNVVTHTSILKGLCIVGKSDEAVKHLKQMVSLGKKPDVKSYGVVVNVYCKMRKPNEAISLLREMQVRGINPSVSSFNAVLRILVENGDIERAISILKQMPLMGCSPNFLSYNTVICSLCKIRGRMQEVGELVCIMLQNGHNLDATIYSCLVRGYCEDGNEEMALQTFYETIDKNYVINLETFSVFVKELFAKGKINEAKSIFEDMLRKCPVFNKRYYEMVLTDLLYLHSEKLQRPTG